MRFQPCFRYGYDMVEVVEEIIMEFVIMSGKGLGIDVTGC